MLRKIISLFFVLVIVACKKSASPAKAMLNEHRENLLENCPNCDYECFEKKSNAAFERQMACLKDVKTSLESLGSKWARVVDIAGKLVDLIRYLERTPILIEKEELVKVASGELAGVVSAGGYTFWNIVRDLISGKTEKIPIKGLRECMKGVNGSTKSLEKIYSKVLAIMSFEELSFTSLKELGVDLVEMTIAMEKVAQDLKSCEVKDASKSVKAVVEQINRLESTLSFLEKEFMPIMTVVNCSVGIFNGSVVLANNMSCYMEDLDNLSKSEERLKKARQSILPSDNKVTGAATSKQSTYTNDQGLCYGDAHNCSLWAMGVYGEYLRRNAPYFGKAEYCSSRCRTNSGENQQKCITDSEQIFTGEAKNCGEFCQYSTYVKGETGYCQSALNRCISYCCNQDGTCADAAKALR